MRVTRVEKGHIYTRDTKTRYEIIYTQPLKDFVNAWLFHFVWEKAIWKIARYFERYQSRNILTIPYSNRLDITCHDLHMKNRKVISTKEGDS